MAIRRYRSRRTTAPPGQYLTGGLLVHDNQGNLSPKPIGVSKRASKNLQNEHQEQSAFFSQIEKNAQRAPELLRFRAIPNGGYRGERVEYKRKDGRIGDYNPVAYKLKAEGVRAGTLDTLCTVARRGYHSLWIEFKVNDNTLSEEQQRERELLLAEGHSVHTVWTWVEAWHVCIWYFDYDPEQLFMPLKNGFFDNGRGHDLKCGCDLQLRAMPSWDYQKSRNIFR